MKSGLTRKLISLSLICTLFMGGCGSEIPEMTEEQQTQVGEYAAFAMLRYDAEHRSRLVDYSEVVAADEAKRLAEEAAAAAEIARQTETGEESKPEGSYDAEGNPVDVIDNTDGNAGYVSDTMEDFLELPNGVLLTYRGYSIQSSYPEDADYSDYFVVDATAGNKFLVLWYSIYNGSGSEASVDFLADNIAFKCRVNDSNTATALVTMLDDDMSTLQTVMRDNDEMDCVLVFEINTDLANNIDSIVVRLSKNGADWERRLQ
ncbi:MAG: hypothetical protein J6X94_02565 [Lachnospiraceae bacterium]|nr:hypothetical protein [Lachnospiraceae bacterium]